MELKENHIYKIKYKWGLKSENVISIVRVNKPKGNHFINCTILKWIKKPNCCNQEVLKRNHIHSFYKKAIADIEELTLDSEILAILL